MRAPRFMIASDLHGAAGYTRRLIEAWERKRSDMLILLGDLLYHGPRNDLPDEYDPKAVIRLLSPLAPKILAVRGNCDTEVDQMVLPFPLMADYSVLPVAADGVYRRLFLTHGHHYNIQTPPPLSRGDILLHGHTHVPACLHRPEGWWYLNPGSVSIPKEGSPRGYMLLEDGAFIWKTLSGEEWQRTPLGAPPTVKRVF